MRKSKKKELCSCIHTLKNANKKIKSANARIREEVLPQCQEMAIMVGTDIDRIVGEGTITVSYLEEYCEELYQASIAPDQDVWRTSCKKIDKLLDTIDGSIRNDLPDSPGEIVFMPYKVSMWDALDSVYRAAVQQGNYHVTVLPIPYFNINRKDQRMDLHYEGDQFPADVPIVDFREYHLEKERPDVIFIHNPYDDCNFVTRVPEEYFSSELVKYTEHLVYIPYFVARGDRIKDEYTVMPAVGNAWRTFVQSEAVRKCYLKNGADPEKILAMGSPKFDMVLRTQKNPLQIPVEWEKALAGRKVFLLNTHLTPIINETEKVIDKLHQIFELFKKREDAALLWRPHPLSIETAKAMNPRILEGYLALIDEFRKLPNGVYDESPNAYRAIAVSDAYVGDKSSLVPIYGFTGKPVYITDIKVPTHVEERGVEAKLSFSCAVEIDGYLWAPADEYNGLFKISMETGESEFIAEFTEEKKYGQLLYRRVVLYERKLFFTPFKAKKIAVYNLDTGEIKYYSLRGDVYKNDILFTGCTQKENILYFFPYRASDIVSLDMDKGEIGYHHWEYESLLRDNSVKCFNFFYNEISVGIYEFMPNIRTNILIKLNLENFQNEKISIPMKDKGLLDVAWDQGKIYILSVAGDIYVFDMEKENVSLFWENEEKRPDKKCVYYRILCCGGYLWLLAGYGDRICRIDIATLEACFYDANTLNIKFVETEGIPSYKWYHGETKDGKMILYPRMADSLLIWDETKDKFQTVKVKFSPKHSWIEHFFGENRRYLCDEKECSLAYFVDAVNENGNFGAEERRSYYRNMQLHSDGTCGEAIWRYIEKQL